jgi:hypothetical protein
MNRSICKIDETTKAKHWFLGDKLHREDGPAIEYVDGNEWHYYNDEYIDNWSSEIKQTDWSRFWYINGQRIDPEEAMNDPEFKAKYPKFIESILVYLVHNS